MASLVKFVALASVALALTTSGDGMTSDGAFKQAKDACKKCWRLSKSTKHYFQNKCWFANVDRAPVGMVRDDDKEARKTKGSADMTADDAYKMKGAFTYSTEEVPHFWACPTSGTLYGGKEEGSNVAAEAKEFTGTASKDSFKGSKSVADSQDFSYEF